MKKQARYSALRLDDLLEFARSYDEGTCSLDDYQVYEVIKRLLIDAQDKLGVNIAMRLGGATVEKSAAGNVFLHLKNRGLSLTLSPGAKIRAA